MKQETVTINYEEENKVLHSKLTKRHVDYMRDIDKRLTQEGMADAEKQRVLHEMMTVLVDGQKTGKTAQQLFGTVTHQVDWVLHGSKEAAAQAPSPDWQIMVDNGLLVGSLFALMSAYQAYRQDGLALGILTLLLNYILSGFIMLHMVKNTPKRGERGLLRYALVAMLSVIGWGVGIGVLALLPSSINPALPPIAYAIIGATTLVAKFFFKRRYNVRGGIF